MQASRILPQCRRLASTTAPVPLDNRLLASRRFGPYAIVAAAELVAAALEQRYRHEGVDFESCWGRFTMQRDAVALVKLSQAELALRCGIGKRKAAEAIKTLLESRWVARVETSVGERWLLNRHDAAPHNVCKRGGYTNVRLRGSGCIRIRCLSLILQDKQFAGRIWLAQRLHCSTKQVTRLQAQLEVEGEIVRERRPGRATICRQNGVQMSLPREKRGPDVPQINLSNQSTTGAAAPLAPVGSVGGVITHCARPSRALEAPGRRSQLQVSEESFPPLTGMAYRISAPRPTKFVRGRNAIGNRILLARIRERERARLAA